MSPRLLIPVAILFAVIPSELRAEHEEFETAVRPILVQLCGECHGPGSEESDLRIDQLNPDFLRGGDADTWHDVLNKINLGEMPPSRAKRQPTDSEREILTNWLNQSLDELAAKKRSAGRVSSRRLTRYEYASTMRDLLGIDFDFARELPPEPASSEGFLNNGATLEMSPTQLETYLAVARRSLEIAIVDGERPQIHRYEAKQTAVGKLPKRKEGNAIPVNPEFLLDVKTFPRTGEFRIEVTAGAIVPDGDDFPRMRVSLGCVPGIVHVPRKLVGEVDVTASVDEPETFVFRGRMEDFPQAGDREFGNVAFKGVIVLIDYLDADGNELRDPNRSYADPQPEPRKGRRTKGKPENNDKVAEKDKVDDDEAEKNSSVVHAEPKLDIVVNSVRYEAPYITSWPPRSHVALVGQSDVASGPVEASDESAANEASDECERARELLQRFMSRAFRRPVTDQELEKTFDLFQRVRGNSSSFDSAMRETFASVLVSPHFLYLVNTGDDFAIASRLSYFLWSTMPDEELLKLAEQGKLQDPSVLAKQVDRLLDDERSQAFVRHFADQWFDLGGMDRVAVNPEFYPEFDNGLKDAMRHETQGVLAEIVANNLSCTELLQSDWTVVNRALAKHYGLAQQPRSSEFVRVELTPEDRRGGILHHGSFLLSNSNGESSHPIKRAVWILDRLLDSPPAPPPPDVPELEPERPDLKGLTLKEQLAVHRTKAACNSCHRNIDPWGIALENYDAIGLYRTEAILRNPGAKKPRKGPDIDSSTTLPTGDKISGAGDLKRFLVIHRREQFARAVVKRLATYALGRSLDIQDRNQIEQLTDQFMKDDFRFRTLIANLAQSEMFLNRKGR